MKIKDISIKWQLLIICILLVSLPIITMGIISYNTLKAETFVQIEEKLTQQTDLIKENVDQIYHIAQNRVNSNLNVARCALEEEGRPYLDNSNPLKVFITHQITKESKTIQIPSMKNTQGEIYQNYEFVDKVQKLVGGTSTIFQIVPEGALRISTNVLKLDGERAIGTYIPLDSPVYQKVVLEGKTFYGRAYVVNAWYLTAYEPIKDNNGMVIGILYVGIKEADFQKDLMESLSTIVVGKSGYVFILSDEGDYILSLRQERDGENIWKAEDANGVLFIQEMITKSQDLEPGETALQYYPWQNKGESESRLKVAGLSYFPEWEWTIGSSAYQDDFLDSLTNIQNITFSVVIFAILISTIVAYLFAAYITKTLSELIKDMDDIASGNLEIDIHQDKFGKNELGIMAVALSKMLDSLRHLVTNILNNSNRIASTSEELSASTEQVNSSMEQISSTIQEISKSAQSLSSNAGDVVDKSKKTEQSSMEGQKAAKGIFDSMAIISSSTKKGAAEIKALGEKSQKIGEIVDTINNISEQTNLLALNAAIEAARAGEAGRGFAVVADEVRKLAEESQKATAQISSLIKGIQSEIQSSVNTMTENTELVDKGGISVNQALSSFEIIPKLVGEVNKAITDMSAIAEENSAGTEEVTASVEEITNSMQQISTTAEELSQGSENLKRLVSKFRLQSDQKDSKKDNKNESNKNPQSDHQGLNGWSGDHV